MKLKNDEYLHAFDEFPEGESVEHDNGNIGGIISAIVTWIVFLGLVFVILNWLGGIL
jgi:hypothetical protein